MSTRSALFLVLFLNPLAACRGPLIQGSGSGARIRPPGPTADAVRCIVDEYEKKVIQILGTRYDREYVIEILPENEEIIGEVDKTSRRLLLGKRGIATEHDMTHTVIHELVHVHATGLWEEAPDMLEDGFAHVIAHLLTDGLEQLSGGPPTVDEYLEVLTLDYQRDFRPASPERTKQLAWNATCLAYLILRNSAAVSMSEGEWRLELQGAPLRLQAQEGKMLLRVNPSNSP
ncbi:MAG: hypothetical protein ABL998_10910 [Planctomycetota bacterium]